MAKIQFSGDSNVSKPVRRMRWATVRHQGQSGTKKRQSLLSRVPKVRLSTYEEKPSQDGKDDHGQITDISPMGEVQEMKESKSRNVYMNVPLPEEEKTEDGYNKQQFVRNKIRTAKYTPLSFIPKNLYFQFHNIANIYFLFIIILCVSSSRAHSGTLADITDFPYFRCFEPWSKRGASDLRPYCYRHQRRY